MPPNSTFTDIQRSHSRRWFLKDCLLARRPVEKGVRFVELFHESSDQHGNLTYRAQGRDFRLTDVHGKIVDKILV